MVPAVSPDGRHLAVVLVHGDGSAVEQSVVVLTLPDGRVREIYRSRNLARFARWRSDGHELIIANGRALMAISISGGMPRPLDLPLVPAPQTTEHLQVHPDGRRLVYIAGEARRELWSIENFLAGGRSP